MATKAYELTLKYANGIVVIIHHTSDNDEQSDLIKDLFDFIARRFTIIGFIKSTVDETTPEKISELILNEICSKIEWYFEPFDKDFHEPTIELIGQIVSLTPFTYDFTAKVDWPDEDLEDYYDLDPWDQYWYDQYGDYGEDEDMYSDYGNYILDH